MYSVSRDKQINARTSFLPDCLLFVAVSFYVCTFPQVHSNSFPQEFVSPYIDALTIIHHTEAMIVVLSVIY